jgi:hypothetical protein
MTRELRSIGTSRALSGASLQLAPPTPFAKMDRGGVRLGRRPRLASSLLGLVVASRTPALGSVHNLMVKGARLQPCMAMKRPNLAPDSPGWGFESAVLARTRPCETRPRTCSEHQGLAKRARATRPKTRCNANRLWTARLPSRLRRGGGGSNSLESLGGLRSLRELEKDGAVLRRRSSSGSLRRKPAALIDELHSLMARKRFLFPRQGVFA